MQRYFIKEFDNIDYKHFTLSDKDSYHLKKVMRKKLGDKIEVVSKENTFICEIIDIDNNVRCKVIDTIISSSELPVDITIAQSIIKEQKMDYAIQKATELGANVIIPLIAKNNVVKVDSKETKKVNRWQTIVKEASEQSKRNSIPLVTSPFTINDLLISEYDIKILCSVNNASTTIKKVLQKTKKNDRIIIVVGPEGGLSKEEEQKFIDNGYISTSLGSLVLRSETVSLYALSIINYYFMR